jgi:MFS family permease
MKYVLWPFIVNTYMPDIMAPFYTGVIFASMGVIAGLLSPIIGRMSDRYKPTGIFFSGWILAGIAGMLFNFSTGFELFYVTSALYAVGEVMKGPSSSLIVTNATSKSNRGFFFGTITSIGALAYFFGPVVSGALMNIVDWHFLLLIYGAMIFVPAIFFYALLSMDGKERLFLRKSG